jgi:hypothetical protein
MDTSATSSDTIRKGTQALMLVLEAAEMRGLPMPFAVNAYDYTDRVELQFQTRAAVATWAELIAAEVSESRHVDNRRISDVTVAEGAWLDVPLRLAASVPCSERVAS